MSSTQMRVLIHNKGSGTAVKTPYLVESYIYPDKLRKLPFVMQIEWH